MAQERQNTKGYSHLHTSTVLYVVCEGGDHAWRPVTESLPRKNAILKQGWPVQRKRTITERTIFKLANLDGSLCWFFLNNNNNNNKILPLNIKAYL